MSLWTKLFGIKETTPAPPPTMEELAKLAASINELPPSNNPMQAAALSILRATASVMAHLPKTSGSVQEKKAVLVTNDQTLTKIEAMMGTEHKGVKLLRRMAVMVKTIIEQSGDDAHMMIPRVEAGHQLPQKETRPQSNDASTHRESAIAVAEAGQDQAALESFPPNQIPGFTGIRIADLPVHERSHLSAVTPVMCAFAIREKEGADDLTFTEVGTNHLQILRKLDIEELKTLQKSIEFVIKGDECQNEVQAAEFYRKAFEINPFDDIALMSYGSLIAGQGKLVEGIRWVKKAIEVNPTNARAIANLRAMEQDLR